MSVLVTGGAGNIGSHTCVELLNSGYSIVIVDDLPNSSEESLNRIRKITGKDFMFYKMDITDKNSFELIFEKENIESAIHLEALMRCVPSLWGWQTNNPNIYENATKRSQL